MKLLVKFVFAVSLLICFSYSTSFVQAQTFSQLGADIIGEAANDHSGGAVSISSDGTVVAIGAAGNSSVAGYVRVYEWNGSGWTQRGSDIDGEAVGDNFGLAISLSADGTVVAIGAKHNDGNGLSAGHVRVYEWNGSSWSQRGSDIDGSAAGDQSGTSVSLSKDGLVVAIGAPFYTGSQKYGHVRIFEWNGLSWSQRGSDIIGEVSDDLFGDAVALSADGTVVAGGAYSNDDSGTNAGHVRVFEWSGGSWSQRGSDIDGDGAEDESGRAVSLSADGTVLAIGSAKNDNTATDAGQVRIFEWNGASWSQRGADINGEAGGDESGTSVSLSADGTALAIGAPYNDGNGGEAGQVRIFDWDGSSWNQRGSDIDGEQGAIGDEEEGSPGDNFGRAVALSADGAVVAAGATNNGASNNGHVQVYQSATTLTLTGSAGWRLLSTGFIEQTYDDLLDNLWTQGFTNADVTVGTSNVYTWATGDATTNSSNWTSLSNQTDSVESGTGIAVYLYSDDNGPDTGGDAGFPKSISYTGFQPSEDIEITVNANNNGWALVGNPFNTTIDWDSATTANLTSSAYVWDTGSSQWISWNGSTGSLTDGLIERFQGFFVQSSSSGTPSLSIPLKAQVGDGNFFGKSRADLNSSLVTLPIKIEHQNLSNTLWLSFEEDAKLGLDRKDAFKLVPLSSEFIQVSQVIDESISLDISALPLGFEEYSIPIAVNSTVSGEFSLSIDRTRVSESWSFELIDNETGKSSDLIENYNFTIEVSQKNSPSAISEMLTSGNPIKAKALSERFLLNITTNQEVSNETEARIESFKLHPAYPNPFNPSTNIEFELSKSTNVSLEIFDIMGRKVAELISGYQQAGLSRVKWDAVNISSGIYFVKLRSEGKVLTQKIMLIK